MKHAFKHFPTIAIAVLVAFTFIACEQSQGPVNNGRTQSSPPQGDRPHVELPRIFNGTWWIGNYNTGIPAQGSQGPQGTTPHIGTNGNWWIGSMDTGVAPRGQDGTAPHIGTNGNWWIGSMDTGVAAQGLDGVTPHIGWNGNWWIGSTDTGVSPQGIPGEQGPPGIMVPVTSISLSGYGLTRISEGTYTLSITEGSTTVLTATVTPNYALVQTLLWEVSGNGVQRITRVPRSVLTFTEPDTALEVRAASSSGEATISATALGSGGVGVTATITVQVAQ